MKTEPLKRRITGWGASLVGFADMTGLVPGLESLNRAVSIALRLSSSIIDGIGAGPTPTYAHHYRTANQLLDTIALKTANLLQSQGFQALPVPASQTIDKHQLKGLISHKMAATRAGLGWIGKNALLITPQYGPRIRLVTVLTDAPLQTGQPTTESQCGDCHLCVEACPAKALKGKTWTVNTPREDLITVTQCHNITEHNRTIVGEPVCGLCIRVCPIGGTKD